MQYTQYTDVHAFYHVTYPLLMQNEAQNLIPLGNVILGHKGTDRTGWRDPDQWLMATVSDAQGVQLIAMMTPPFYITLYAPVSPVQPQALDCLLDGLAGQDIPGVTTEKALAEAFAQAYAARHGCTWKIEMSQRIYTLKKVDPQIKQVGKVRLLEERDMPFFPYWMEAMKAAGNYGQTEMHIPQEGAEYQEMIARKKLYVLEDQGLPVSMAGFSKEMETAIGVTTVYTPPYFRNRGYATSCVAQVSQLALDKGFTQCVLYTDLKNPTSNSIYQKIGYRPVCDSLMLRFEKS